MAEMKSIEDLNSVYTLKYFMLSCSAYRDKDSSLKNFDKVRQNIIKNTEKLWLNSKLRKNPKRAGSRWRALNRLAQKDLNNYYLKLDKIATQDAEMGVWFDSVRKGYTLFCDNLGEIMQDITRQKWQKISCNFTEKGQTRFCEFLVAEKFLENGFFNDIQGLTELDLDGEIISNTIGKAISYGGCIFLSDGEYYSFEKNTTKLSKDTAPLPLMSFPLKKGDKQSIDDLAIVYKSAQNEQEYLATLNEFNEGNYYFTQFPQLQDYLNSAIKNVNKENMVVDYDFLYSQYSAGLTETYSKQMLKLDEDLNALEQKYTEEFQMQK